MGIALRPTYLLATFIFLYGCQYPKVLDPVEGYVTVRGGKVWYCVFKEGEKTPLLVLHGGPGVPSYYLNPLSELSDDRPIILLDQLGCGRSDHVNDTSLMTIENYVEQLNVVVDDLGLEEFYLYGHSWGSMLGMDYYLKYPEKIRGIVFSSPLLSARMWAGDADTLIQTLDDSLQRHIAESESRNSFDNPGFAKAMEAYYEKYVARKRPLPEDLEKAFDHTNYEVYFHMWGPSEFTATGNLKTYERTSDLNRVDVPVLFTAGEYDEVRPATLKFYQDLTPNARLELIPDAAHFTMNDNPSAHNRVIRNFLNHLDGED